MGVVVQPDGKAVVGGYSHNGSNYDFALVRYNVNGTLDTTFDGDGKVTTPIGSGEDYGWAVALQSDGKIILGGYSFNGSNEDLALVRYNSNGSLDTTFGAGGKVVTPVGTGRDEIRGIAIQPDGKIVVSGFATSASSDFVVARYNANGTLDASFNGTGTNTLSFGVTFEESFDVALQSDGKIVTVGIAYNGSNYDMAIARLNANGTLDTSFDGDGKRILAIGIGTESGRSVAIQNDGKIVVGGYNYNGSNDDFVVVRLTSSGALDSTFDGDGIANVPILVSDLGFDMALQPDGKIVMAGAISNGSGYDYGLMRLNTNGSLDNSFDDNGFLSTAIGTGDDYALSIAMQGSSKIVVAGTSRVGSNDDFSVARYTMNNTIDLGALFATQGTTIFGADADDNSGFSVSDAGDINGDGFDELIIGASYGDASGNTKANAGESYVIFGKADWSTTPTIDLANLGSAGITIFGANASDQSGRSVSSAGDVNGDGFDDLAIGAIGGDALGNAKSDAGESYVIFGKGDWSSTPTIDLASLGTAGITIFGAESGDTSGRSVSSAGDVNGDGYDDLLIGAPRANATGDANLYAGDSYVIFGRSNWYTMSTIDLASLGTAGITIFGADAVDFSGVSVSGAGDVNGTASTICSLGRLEAMGREILRTAPVTAM